ncbi:MAG: hypothetical protein Kow0080_22440 [Candidatus Promineifilaceae bacterium]
MDLQLPTFNVEVLAPPFLLQAKFQPRGSFFIYLNDPRYLSFHFNDTKMSSIFPNYRIKTLKQDGMNLNRHMITYIALQEKADLERVQYLHSHRPITIYTENVVIRGCFHVNPDANENDLLDETRDFLTVSEADVYPIRPLTHTPTRHVPMLAINSQHILGYHAHEPEKTS